MSQNSAGRQIAVLFFWVSNQWQVRRMLLLANIVRA